jgi:hypothetical protein
MIETILLSTVRVSTYEGSNPLTNASGFLFEREDRLFLVTSRHVMFDEPKKHFPDRIEIELHTDPDNVAETSGFSIPLYQDEKSAWRQGKDSAGAIDVAAIEIDRAALPPTATLCCFTPAHLLDMQETLEIGTSVLILGFPMGFHDALHRIPIARHGIISSSFGLRFQGEGYFLTDARTHRGSSGAPVVLRADQPDAALGNLPWKLLGIHSSRVDIKTREADEDEALGLNTAWYADILLTLTEG